MTQKQKQRELDAPYTYPRNARHFRDEIAVRVLPHVIPNPASHVVPHIAAMECARHAYAWADVMLRVREEA